MHTISEIVEAALRRDRFEAFQTKLRRTAAPKDLKSWERQAPAWHLFNNRS